MAFLNKEGLQYLTNNIVKGENIKVSSHRGDNVKTVIDNITRECESIAEPNTMNLENIVAEFKVGKGKDVDVSGDVEEGKVEVELKGRTYQNLCSSSASFYAHYIDNYDIKDFNDRIVVTRISETKEGWTYCENITLKNKLLKENTYYTLFFRYESSCNNNVRVQFINGNALNDLSASYTVTKIKDNIYRCVILTHNSFQNKVIGGQVLYFHYSEPKKNGDIITLYKDMILLEGDYSQTPIEELPPFFEGIKSSFEDGIVDIEVQGKNLFDGSLRTFNTENTYIETLGGHMNHIDKDNNIRISPNTKYTITFETSSPDSNIYLWNEGVRVADIHAGNNTIQFTTPNKCDYLSFYRNLASYTGNRLEYKVQLEISTKTPYEPYYKKKISFNIEEPLRSLPDGTCDEIRNNNGQWELVRKIKKVILNGSETWDEPKNGNPSLGEVNNKMYQLSKSLTKKDNNKINLLCNNFPCYTANFTWSNDVEGISLNVNGHLQIRVKNSKLSDITAAGLKSWLSQNPITIYYELETPIITPIEPIEFNIKPNATISIDSDIAPISNYSVLLNRSAQIEQSIIEIAELRNRINEIEKIYDSSLIANSLKLDLLSLNYDLNNKEDN